MRKKKFCKELVCRIENLRLYLRLIVLRQNKIKTKKRKRKSKKEKRRAIN